MDTTGVYINKDGPYPNEVESLEDMDWERDKCLSHKLKATSYGDWQFNIGMINIKYFENREKLDNIFIGKSEQTISKTCINIERISIQKAVKLFNIEFLRSMDWYLNNQNEMEMDFDRKILNLDLNNEYLMKKLEQELFYKQICKLFEEIEDDHNKPENDDTIYEKCFILKYFRVLFTNENYMFATAKRGNYYLLFSFVY
ncbi:unnamed protein product [Didymodactylos carnosus]|uniref:Uncharacterized protein n=1 Tax=Didymodactylos carnosus TaxID=1234261 RepID=A0A815AR66_9BILA|nr:unnamed protein product [Didymodactylos carnosus]CAF4036969.1 unnamed protein product [Didymodactylos carnosus]